jgi:hypothetical protein
VRFAERGGDVRDVPDSEGDRISVKFGVGKLSVSAFSCFQLSPSMPRFLARSMPTSSMSWLMSLTITLAPRRAMRKAMSPVPPAMSRMRSPGRGATLATNRPSTIGAFRPT